MPHEVLFIIVRFKLIFFIYSKLSRWQAAMMQFLRVPAKDITV
jgi:hypothetical protein